MSNKKDNRKTGNLGEEIAANFLRNKGFKIVERNYWRKWGEIDIVTQETFPSEEIKMFSRETFDIIHFVEVKSVSYETRALLNATVSYETWRPEELVHRFKLGQISKAAESWIKENNWDGEVQIDVVAVRMVPREKYATVKFIPNVIIE